MNENASKRLGYTREELRQLKLPDIYPTDNLKRPWNIADRILEQREVTFETIHVRKDGTHMPVESTSRCIEIAGRTVVESFVRDITERKQAEDALQKSEAKFRQLADGSIAGVHIHRGYQTIIANQAYADIFGYESPDEILALGNVLQLIAPHERERLEGYRKNRLAGKPAPSSYEYQGVRKDGTMIWLESHVRVVDWEGEPVNQVTLIDISERKRAEQALSKSSELLLHAQKMARLGSWEVDYDKNTVIWSDEVYRMIGMERADFDGVPNSYLAYVHPDDRDRIARKAEDLKEGKDLEYTYRMVRPNGEERIVHSQAVATHFENGKVRQARGFIQDITERKRVEDALRESETRLAAAQRVASIGSWTWTAKNNSLHWSDEHYRIFGIEPIGRDVSYELFLDCVHPDDREMVIKSVEAFRESDGFGHTDYRIIRPNGERRFIRGWSEVEFDDAEEPMLMRGAVQDVTESQLEVEATRAAEGRLSAILENMPVAVNEKDLSGRYQYMNPEFLRHTQYGRDEILGKTARDIYPDLAAILEEKERIVRDTRSAVQADYVEPRPEGDKHFLMTKFPLMNAAGEIESIVTLETDITERKHTEQALIESEARFRTIVQDAVFGICITGLDDGMRICNPAFCKMLGYEAGELDDIPWLTYTHPDDVDEDERLCGQLIRGEIESFKMEKRFLRKDGEIVWANLTATLAGDDADGSRIQVGMLEDISERKRAAEALRESESRLAESQRIARVGSWSWDSATDALLWSDEHYRIFDIEPIGCEVTYEDFIARVHPDDREKIVENIEAARHSGGFGTVEYRIVRPDGETRVIRAWSDAYLDGSANLHPMRGVIQDITEIRRQGEAKRAAESRLIAILDNLPWTIDQKDKLGRYNYVNPKALARTGLARKEVIGKTARDIYPETAAIFEQKDQIVRETRAAVQFDYIEPHAEGDQHFLMTKFPLMDATGEIESIVSMEADITERKRAEQALGQSEARFRAIFEDASFGIAISGIHEQLRLCNPAYSSMLGYEIGELDGAPWSNHTHPDDIANNQLLTDQLVRGEIETFQMEKRYLHKDGSVVWAHLNASIVGDDVEIPRFQVTMIEDISERKGMEESLLASEQRYRSLIEDQPEFVCRYKPDGRMVYANSAVAKQHGFDPDDAAEQNIFDFLVESDRGRTLEYIAQLRPEQESARIELRAQIADGSIRWQEWSDRAFFDDRGRILEIQAFGRDVTDRKNAEEMLRKSEGRLAEAQQLAQIGSWERNFKTENSTWSDQMYRLYGVDPGAAPPSTELFLDRVHPDDQEAVRRALSGQETPGRAHDYNHRVLRQDGQIGFVQQRVEQVFDELGGLIGVRGTTQDITDLKRAGDELQESEESLRLITDNVPALISYVDSERRYKFMNERYEEWTGKPNSERLGRQIWENLGQKYYRRLEPWITRALDGERVRFETDNVFADGISRYLDIEYVPDIGADGRTKGYYSVINDITERKTAENALRESEANLSRAQAISGVGSWSWDIATNLNHWSAEHYRIFGMEPTGAPVSYDEFLSMVHEEDQETVDAALKETLRTGETYEVEYRLVRKDGKIRRAQATGEVEHDESGKPVTMRGAVQDITERSHVEEQLRQAQKMEAIGQLTGGIAHDFNNLLAVILGNLELIGERVKGDSDIDDLIERGLSASDRGAALTHRLLAFSRKQTLRPTRTDLNKLAANMTDMLSRTLGETVEIRTQGTIDLWPCSTDQAQFENALLNLSINARDAMPGGGTLTIETANLSLTDTASASEAELTPGEYVQLSVSDTGSGIPAEALEHVFEPFFTTKEVGKGSGMGLSMVYGFAKQSGGTATITSTPGQGTIVHLYLPRASAVADTPVARLAAANIPTADGEKILLVEDDKEVRALAVEMLTSLGYDIAEANCAEAALDLLNQSVPFDLLLTDVVLPGAMSGPDLATKIRHLRPDIKELFMTGYAAEAFNGQQKLHSESRILQKPFRKAELATIVRDVLDER